MKNTPHTYGRLLPDNFSPFPKNPVIAKFFTQIGHVDELGSGILNVNKYLPFYAPGQLPVFEEGDMFRITIPLEAQEAGGVNEGINEAVIEGIILNHFSGLNNEAISRLTNVLNLTASNSKLNTSSLATILNTSESTVKRNLKLLKSKGLIQFTGTPKTGYYEPTAYLTSLLTQ